MIWVRCLTLLVGRVLCVCLSRAASVPLLGATDVNQLADEANGAVDNQHRLQQDPITSIRVMYPADGAVETIPLEFRAEISVKSIQEYTRFYGDKILCVEVDGRSRETKCSPLMKPSIVFDALSTGNYTARAVITNVEDGGIWYHESPDTTFSIVSETLATRASDSSDLLNAMGLLEWATLEQAMGTDRRNEKKETTSSILPGLMTTDGKSEYLLVVGVKTAVVENFALRQAIRHTWASVNALPPDVKVIFVGCAPALTALQSADEQEHIRKAVDLEKQTYGDLLTDELHCEDSYDDLPNKVKEFLRFTTEAFPQTPFVMVADDDIYLRADRLADELRKEGRSERLYIGQVWDELLGRRQTPVRNTTERYYISEKSYPLHAYPPFAFGPHYLLSMDCARFIAKNRDRLHGLGGMDDVSIAMWLLTRQVHVEHTPAFSSLQLRECQNGVISFADLSASGIRAVHSNVVEQRNICDGFDRKAWGKIELTRAAVKAILTGDNLLSVKIQTFVHDISTTTYLKVTSIISTPSDDGVQISYCPSAETFQSYAERICTEARRLVGSIESTTSACRPLSLKLRTQLQQQLQIAEALEMIDPAYLELWRYNLNIADLNAPPVVVAYSAHAVYAFIVLECLFATVFEHLKRPILVVSEETLSAHYESRPAVFVFSVLDGVCEPMSKPGCVQYYLGKYTGHSNTSDATRFMMISGETTTTESLDEQVLLLSTISGIPRTNYAYISVASTSFGVRLNHTPMALLTASATTYPELTTERQFCAYLYARCDRPQREYMFDLLNALEPVDALGVCAGSSRRPDPLRLTSRYSTWYNDDAVTTFQRYKFVIAFENGAVPGYVTEKLVNPFLAGSIPIYLGSPSVSELFNPDSFIDCGLFKKLADCAAYVMKVHNSPELYARMRREPPIQNMTAFKEAFSWHPSVQSRSLADNVARILAS